MHVPELHDHQTLMKRFAAPWCLGGGWACDGWVGRVTRPHDDVDIVIWRQDQLAFRSAFDDWHWESHAKGASREWSLGTCLELPCHNAHGRRAEERLEVLMIERDGTDWWYRRNPLIRMPAARVMLRSPAGVTVLNPAIALLFKSTRLEAKDHHDFAMVAPILEPEDRTWLRQALTAAHPQHAWIRSL